MRYLRLVLISIIAFSFSCKETSTTDSDPDGLYEVIQGETMGTYYRVNYGSVDQVSKSQIISKIDSILFIVNDEMSTYIDTSFISRFNRNEKATSKVSEHFKEVFDCAKRTHQYSDGSFDPTVMPLANYWGFGYSGKVAREKWDPTQIKQLAEIVGFDKITLDEDGLHKTKKDMQLDFSALAKGYGADLIAREMHSLGIDNILVDIGGDGYARGKNKKGNDWTVGINIPDSEAAYTEIYVALKLDQKGLATSGNYRNYYEVDGEQYGHTLNAKTGFPFKSNVLSASVIANTAMEADALATACMASDLEAGLAMIKKLPGAEAYLIYHDAEGNMKEKYTAGFKDHILE